MKFDELDSQMRVYETANDRCVPPDIHIVARIDGRGFTKLTKEREKFDAPFDIRFRDMMVATVEHLMNCGFRVVYGYTQSDEISLLFHVDDRSFGRKTRKWDSILAGEASAKFSLLLGALGAFDCRICELPSVKRVVDYFRWRNEDAARNALNAHCYWFLRRNGASAEDATESTRGMSIEQKNQMLWEGGINFNDLPAWQKRGVGLYWSEVEHEGIDPRDGSKTVVMRRKIIRDFELPLGEEYSQFMWRLLSDRSDS